MAKSKWETHVKDRLIEVEGWARDGLTDEQIAKNLGIAYSTLREYREKYSALSAALKRGKEVVDREVENALLKRALGYNYVEETTEELPNGTTKSKTVIKHIPGDTTAQIFWLKNRKPDVWRDKTAIEHSGEIKGDNPFSNLTTEELKKVIFGDK
ncbi:MAG: transposase [Fusobacterium sp.]|uniref:transposase n=1 Tax=Fusobacterium sp. TaxID=68766 RepID=UPI00399B7659